MHMSLTLRDFLLCLVESSLSQFTTWYSQVQSSSSCSNSLHVNYYCATRSSYTNESTYPTHNKSISVQVIMCDSKNNNLYPSDERYCKIFFRCSKFKLTEVVSKYSIQSDNQHWHSKRNIQYSQQCYFSLANCHFWPTLTGDTHL